jgi:hypothetical protein
VEAFELFEYTKRFKWNGRQRNLGQRSAPWVLHTGTLRVRDDVYDPSPRGRHIARSSQDGAMLRYRRNFTER